MEDTCDKCKVVLTPFPEHRVLGSTQNNNWKEVILKIYSYVVTLAIIFITVGGCIYWTKRSVKPLDDDQLRLLVTPEGAMIETDEVHHTETFFTPGVNSSIAVIDFHQNTMGVFLKEADMCLVATGNNFQLFKETGMYSYTHEECHLLLTTDEQEVSPDLLPSKMATLCAEKQVVHMNLECHQETSMLTEGGKACWVKRGLMDCHLCCSSCRVECSFTQEYLNLINLILTWLENKSR